MNERDVMTDAELEAVCGGLGKTTAGTRKPPTARPIFRPAPAAIVAAATPAATPRAAPSSGGCSGGVCPI